MIITDIKLKLVQLLILIVAWETFSISVSANKFYLRNVIKWGRKILAIFGSSFFYFIGKIDKLFIHWFR